MTDHDLYGEVASNLSSVEVLEGTRDGLVRRCVDTAGNQWTERCTRWEEGTCFAVAVDVDNSDFHRRLFHRFDGLWRLDERATDVRLTIRFDFVPRNGPFGVLISKCLAYRAPSIIETIFDRWVAEISSRTRETAGQPNQQDAVPYGCSR